MGKLFRGCTQRGNHAAIGCGVSLIILSIVEAMKGAVEGSVNPKVIVVLGVLGLIFGLVSNYYYEDCKKMELDFFTPDDELHEKICRECAIIRHECKNGDRIAVMIIVFLLVAYISQTVHESIAPPAMLPRDMMMNLLMYFLLPGFLAMIPTFFIWNVLNNKKMARLVNGEYLVAEATVTESYKVSHTNSKQGSYRYFVILEDCFGVKGRFVISEDTYKAMDAGDTVLLVKPERGRMFHNHMEPIVK